MQFATITADNEITVFPPDLPECRLLCEMNPLVEEVPVGAIKEDQPLALGEIAARMVMNWSRKNDTLQKLLSEFPALQSSGRCYICGNNFLSVWLECVKFTNVETAGLIRSVFVNDLVRILIGWKSHSKSELDKLVRERMKVAQQNVSLSKDFCAHINVSIKLDTTTMALQYHNHEKNSLIKLVSGNLSFMAENTFLVNWTIHYVILFVWKFLVRSG